MIKSKKLRKKAFAKMNRLLKRVHRRTRKFSDAEIEADITAARQEVRDAHRQQRGGDA